MEHPDAEGRVLRLPIGIAEALYCVVTQTRELLPPEVLKWREELAARLLPELPGWRPFQRWANLRGARLENARLEGADLRGGILDETILDPILAGCADSAHPPE